MKTVQLATFELLRRLQLTTIFGNPGSTEETFLQNFPGDFTYVLGLHEGAVVGMADGYSQATRAPALVNLHTAPGLGNAMGVLATAYQNKTPLIITAGQQHRDMLLMEPWLTNREATTLARPWVKWSYEPARASDVPPALMRAYATALQPPAGPVFLSIPLDDWQHPADGPAVVRSVSQRVAPDPSALENIVKALAVSRAPALVFGASIDRSGAWNQAIKLAEKLNAAVFAAPSCERTPFPEDHSLYAGALPFAIASLEQKLRPFDVVVVIGAPVFRYYPYEPGQYIDQTTRLLHITDDPEEAARAPVGDSVLADPRLAVEALEAALAAHPTIKSAALPRDIPTPPSSVVGAPFPVGSAIAALRDGSPADVILTQEAPSSLPLLRQQWPICAPNTYYTMASGGLGWGLPAAVGLALHQKRLGSRRPILALIGDGSLQYSVQALWTAVQHRLHVVIAVMRNGQYGILKSFALQEQTPQVPGLDLPGIDCAALARGYGCQSASIPAGDLPALQRSIASAFNQTDGPTLLEIPVDSQVNSLLH